MSAKILIVPWDNDYYWKLLENFVKSWGFTSISLDTPVDGMQLNNIAIACQEYRPNILITYLYDWVPNEAYGFGHRLCDMLRSNPKTQDIGLVYFFIRDDVIRDFRGPLPCHADVYMSLPINWEELEQKLQDLVG